MRAAGAVEAKVSLIFLPKLMLRDRLLELFQNLEVHKSLHV